MLRGQCFCAAVQLEIEDAFSYAFYCHCSRCRRRTGAACAAVGGIELDKIRFAEGGEHLHRLGSDVDGYSILCSRCWSRLYDMPKGSERAHVPLGILSEAPTQRPDHHIHVASKAPWYTITDDLPQHAELPR